MARGANPCTYRRGELWSKVQCSGCWVEPDAQDPLYWNDSAHALLYKCERKKGGQYVKPNRPKPWAAIPSLGSPTQWGLQRASGGVGGGHWHDAWLYCGAQLPSPLARCVQVDTPYRRWGGGASRVKPRDCLPEAALSTLLRKATIKELLVRRQWSRQGQARRPGTANCGRGPRTGEGGVRGVPPPRSSGRIQVETTHTRGSPPDRNGFQCAAWVARCIVVARAVIGLAVLRTRIGASTDTFGG